MRSPANDDLKPHVAQRIGKLHILPIRNKHHIRLQSDNRFHARLLDRLRYFGSKLYHIGIDGILHARINGDKPFGRHDAENDLIQGR